MLLEAQNFVINIKRNGTVLTIMWNAVYYSVAPFFHLGKILQLNGTGTPIIFHVGTRDSLHTASEVSTKRMLGPAIQLPEFV